MLKYNNQNRVISRQSKKTHVKLVRRELQEKHDTFNLSKKVYRNDRENRKKNKKR